MAQKTLRKEGIGIDGEVVTDSNGRAAKPQQGGTLYTMVEGDPTNQFFQDTIRKGYEEMEKNEQ